MITHDVKKLISYFEAAPGKRKLAKKLERLQSLHSIAFDLYRSSNALDLITSSEADRLIYEQSSMTEDESTRDAALASYAVIMYAKATDTDPIKTQNKRHKFDPRKHYSPAEKLWHANIMGVRNEVIAHHGPGSHPDGQWANDKSFLHINDSGEAYFSDHCVRANYKGRVMFELATILPIAQAGLVSDIRELERSIFDEISDDHDFWSWLKIEATDKQPISRNDFHARMHMRHGEAMTEIPLTRQDPDDSQD